MREKKGEVERLERGKLSPHHQIGRQTFGCPDGSCELQTSAKVPLSLSLSGGGGIRIRKQRRDDTKCKALALA